MTTVRSRSVPVALAAALLAICAPPAHGTTSPSDTAPHQPAPQAQDAGLQTQEAGLQTQDPGLQAALDDLVKKGATGVTALVDDGTHVRTASSGLARLDTRQPMSPWNSTRVGSITKTFVATVVLQLAEEHRLSLDDSVERWLPGLVPGGEDITIRNLLNHTSGLYNYTDATAWLTTVSTEPTKLWEPREMVAMAVAQPPSFGPGTSWGYSNTNYVLAGMVVEAVTGNSAAEEISARLLRPLRLDSTFLAVTNDVPSGQAHGYFPPSVSARYPGLPTDQPVDTSTWSPTWAWTAGALVSTTRDLSRFYEALLSGRLLLPGSLKEMTTTVATDGDPYGLGMALRHSPCGAVWSHEGGIAGYRSVAATDLTGGRSAVVLMATEPDTTTGPLFDQATELALCHMFGKEPVSPTAGDPVP